jgi:hypothetical protein
MIPYSQYRSYGHNPIHAFILSQHPAVLPICAVFIGALTGWVLRSVH